MRISNNYSNINTPTNNKTDTSTNSFSDTLNKITSYNNFNPRKAKFDELCKVARNLYDSGQISLNEYSDLVIDPTRMKDDMEKSTGIKFSQEILNKFNGTSEVNWIKHFQEIADNSLKFGDMKSYKNHLVSVNILKNFDLQDKNQHGSRHF